MTDPVAQYAESVVSGAEIAGPLVRLACKRHLDDLETADKRGLVWRYKSEDGSEPDASYVVEDFFPKVLKLSGGEHEGRPFTLHPSQAFILGSLFGWYWQDSGVRRYRLAYIEEAKGSGKTPLAAGIGLYMMLADGQARAEIYAAAVDKDQAKILFRDAVTMVQLSDALSARIKCTPQTEDVSKVWNLADHQTGSFFRPIASESKGRGKSGFRPYCVLLDEVHEHPTDAMVEFTRKNIKGRPNALALMITNSGVADKTSVCWSYHNYAERVVNGQNDDQFFGFVCGLDKGDDWKDNAVWRKSNPLLGITIPESYLEQEVRESVGMPSKQSLTRRLNFCEWMGASDPAIDPDVWAANGEKPRVEDGAECYGGLDLSGKNDLTALVLVFPQEDGTKDVLPFFWTPKDSLQERSDRDRAPYRDWVNREYLIAKDGKTIDYAWVAHTIVELTKKYTIKSIAFDPYRINDLIRELEDIGADLVMTPYSQGYKDMDQAIEALEDDLIEHRLRHGNHPVLTWNCANSKFIQNPSGLRRFDKQRSTGRIDGMPALAMADYLSGHKTPEPKYQMFFA